MEKFGEFEASYGTVYYADLGDTVRFADRMKFDDPSWGDMCSGTAVIDARSFEIVHSDMTIDHNHAPDKEALAAAERVLEAYSSQGNDYRVDGSSLDLCEIAEKVSQRTGIQVAAVQHDRSYDTEVTENLEYADYILFCASGDYHGREFAAMCNGYRWTVYDVPKERVEQWIKDDWGSIEDFDFTGQSTDECHGYMWDDATTEGHTTPTYEDLEYAL